MDTTVLLTDAVQRIRKLVHSAIVDLDATQLGWQPGGSGNSIGWLLWHLTRVQDAHVAELIDAEQLWTAGGFARSLGMEVDPSDTGTGTATRRSPHCGSSGPTG